MTTEIRSYRSVFDLERRIYRIDRLRLNPGGVPVRGVVYFLVLVVLCLIAGDVPIIGMAVGTLPWYAVDVVLPGLCAAFLAVINIEGRPFHIAVQALVHHGVWTGRRVAWRSGPGRVQHDVRSRHCRWTPPDLIVLPDGSDAAMRRLRYTGPGAVLVSIAHTREGKSTATFLGRLRSAMGVPQVRLRALLRSGGAVAQPELERFPSQPVVEEARRRGSDVVPAGTVIVLERGTSLETG